MVRAICLTATIALAVLGSPARADAAPGPVVDLPTAKRDATVAGKAWLALVDRQQYADSWTRASALFRQKVAQDQWVAMVRGVRSGLGRLRGRTFDSASYTESGSGALVVLVWKSSFESMGEATEQVTMMLDGDAWRCAGYFVRPP